jgi:HAD superfamily hydrolase (TIGR01509 family)
VGVTISGRLVTGQGKGASFTRLPWAREQFLARLGIDPHPGTLNLVLDEAGTRSSWDALRARPGEPIQPPESGFCAARCYPVRLEGWLPGAIVLPEVPGYPTSQVEVVSALPLRETLSRSDGDHISLEASEPLRVRGVLFDVDGTLVDSPGAFRGATAGVVPGLRETLEALRGRAVCLGIATGSGEASCEPLHREGLMGYFAAVVTGGDVEPRKPDPQALLECAAALGVEPPEAVYVGDAPPDIAAAKAAGMAAVAVLTGAGDSALLSRSGPDRIIASVVLLPDLLEVP